MPEYGRAIQDMVDKAVALPDKEERTRCAHSIIATMGRILHTQENQDDFEIRLWNHLAKISNYKLDIDYPVEIFPEEQATEHPQPLPYPMKHIRRKHYGYLVEECLHYATELPEGEERDALIQMTANQMKQDLFDWNRDAMDEELIAKDIERYTDGDVRLDLSTFRFGPVTNNPSPVPRSKKKKK